MEKQSLSKKQIANAFGTRANSYLLSKTHREGDDLDMLSDWSIGSKLTLDIATGAGHAANAIFKKNSSRVIATDISPKMARIASSAYPSLEMAISDAEHLPFDNNSFDTIICRIAAHHFPNTHTFLAEVARVSDTPGVFLFEDNVAPNTPPLNTFLNKVEKLRDPAHIQSHTVDQWTSWIEQKGFLIEHAIVMKTNISYIPWVTQSNTPQKNLTKLNELFINAPPEAKTLFDIKITNGVVKSFSNLKLLLKAIRPNQ
tara:strand:+ start:445 stop:1215 length:771 start_codon:yes stop_codon:yes gene_type:complete